MKMLKTIAISSIAISVGFFSGVVISATQAEKNMKNAENVQSHTQQKKYNQYLKNNDREGGISQRTGVTAGSTKDGEGAWIGYQWSTK